MFAISATESSIICAGLITAATFLFFRGTKTDNIMPLYFSSLLYAIAAGVKTPAVQAVFSLIFIFCVLEYLSPKRKFFKHFGLFTIFVTFNFILFGVYNYILNYLSFGNFLSSPGALLLHEFYGGVKGFIANFTKYMFALLDCSGMPYAPLIWRILTAVSNIFIALMGIDYEYGSIMSNMDHLDNANAHENTCGLGILGIIIFLPSLITAFKKVNFSKPRKIILFAFALGFLINIIVLSLSVGYMVYNIRFIAMFAMLAVPVTVLFRPGKKLRIVVTTLFVWMFTIFFVIAPARCFHLNVLNFVKEAKLNVNVFKNQVKDYTGLRTKDYKQIVKIINEVGSDAKVLFFLPNNTPTYTVSERLENTEFGLWGLVEKNSVNFDKFDYVVTGVEQKSSYFSGFAPKKIKCVFKGKEGKEYPIEEYDKIISSVCYPDFKLLEKHGFKKVNQYMGDRTYEKALLLYKKTPTDKI
jgi:hypothetical protein